MPWEDQIVSTLRENDIELVAHIPDSATGNLIEKLERDDDFTTVSVAREEEGVGIVTGAWLGHTRGALICQSSGLATTINGLASLAKPAGLPFLGIVSRRGDLGEFNPAQVPFGYNMGTILESMGLRCASLEDTERVEERVTMAAQTAFSTEEPYFLFIETSLMGAKDEF